MNVFHFHSRLDSVTRGTCTDDDQFTTTSTSIQESPAGVCEADPATPVPPPRRGFWRKMMRATVPIQAVFLSSIIMSWVLDPENSMSGGGCNGGDMMMSALYPQLRYLNGPPPIWLHPDSLTKILRIDHHSLATNGQSDPTTTHTIFSVPIIETSVGHIVNSKAKGNSAWLRSPL